MAEMLLSSRANLGSIPGTTKNKNKSNKNKSNKIINNTNIKKKEIEALVKMHKILIKIYQNMSLYCL